MSPSLFDYGLGMVISSVRQISADAIPVSCLCLGNLLREAGRNARYAL
jgi:hypothetical protein